MKKLLIFIFLVSAISSYANYSTPGSGVVWDLDSLVAYSSGDVTFSSNEYFFNDTVFISASDTVIVAANVIMKFAEAVLLDINGVLIINPVDSAVITAQDTSLKFLGLQFNDLSDGSSLKKLIMEYGNSIKIIDSDILIDECALRYNASDGLFSNGAISFFNSNSTVSNSKIFGNKRAAIVSDSAVPSSPQILNNQIYENDADNISTSQISFGPTGINSMIIIGNTITGLHTQCGGISITTSGILAAPDVIIKNNIIKYNKYGISLNGPNSNFYITGNIIDSNNIEGDPLTGGSGINFNGDATQSSVVSRNLIRGNLWGITIQDAAKPNLGDLITVDTSDIGLNEIYSNENSGSYFDLYNNTAGLIKAENNYWGTGDPDSIEAHIIHYPDSVSLGMVDYVPVASIILNLTVGMDGLVRATGRMGRKDTVTVFLRESFSPFAIIDSAKATVDTVSYLGIFTFRNAPTSSYYIDVKHFNSVEIWSKDGNNLMNRNSATTSSYNFTTSASQAYGSNQILSRTKYCMYPGDINQDGIVDLVDQNEVFNQQSEFLEGVRLPCDITGDGFVELRDLLKCYNSASAFVVLESPLNP